jgi:hypothetical protein
MEQTKEQEPIPLMSSVGWRFTLDGKRIGVLQNFTISAGIDRENDHWVHFDGERLEMFPRDKDGNQARVQTYEDENGNIRIPKYKMSERTAELHNGFIVVKNITVDENGNPTVNLMTLLKEKE